MVTTSKSMHRNFFHTFFSVCLCEVKGHKLLRLRPLCREQHQFILILRDRHKYGLLLLPSKSDNFNML